MTDLFDDRFQVHALKLINTNFPRKKRLFSMKIQKVKDILSWSSEFIGSPISKSDDKLVKKNARYIFKKIQLCMHDRPAKVSEREKAFLDIVCKGWQYVSLRDEIFLQLIKQTTLNPSLASVRLGWELMAVCLKTFPPPTAKLRYLLELHIHRYRKFGDQEVITLANVCLERLTNICSNGPRRGMLKPTIEEIQNAKYTILSPSMFGTSLDKLMNMQQSISKFSHLPIPWIQIALSSTILQLGGISTEGIFRIPGDVDKVNSLKAKCDRWNIPINQIAEPHVPASLLKLWYRELADPLVPDCFYTDCVTATNTDQCIQIVDKLPTLNRNVLLYLVQFLQIFALPQHVLLTKMDVNNLALVMAPNCFRCKCVDPREIVQNSRNEMHFLRILIANWKTSQIRELKLNYKLNVEDDKSDFECSSDDSFSPSL